MERSEECMSVKKLVLTFSFFVIFLIPFSNQMFSQNEDPSIHKVIGSHSIDFGQVNPNTFFVFEEEKHTQIFEKAISKAVKKEAIVNMTKPHFDIQIVNQERETEKYHLWVENDESLGVLMKVEETQFIYTIPKEITSQLYLLLEDYMIKSKIQ